MEQAEKERHKKKKDPSAEEVEERDEVKNSIKLIFTHNQAATRTIKKARLEELHGKIADHYGKNVEIRNALQETKSTLITRVERHMGTHYTGIAKNPMRS